MSARSRSPVTPDGVQTTQRMVWVGDTALQALERYTEIRGDQRGRLFLFKHGKAIRPNSIRVMLRQLAE